MKLPLKITLLPLLCFIFALNTYGQNNTNCANAIALTNGIAFVEDTSQATELGDPATLPCDGYVQVGHEVWFTFTPTINSRVIITTAGSTFATALTVYTNFCGSLVNALDAYNNDQCSYSGSPGGANVNFSSVANVTYHILVGGSASTSYGSLQITASTTNPPPNDTCAGAIPLTNGIAFVEDTSQATELGDPATLPCDGYVQVGHGVWFTFTPTINSRVIITTAGSTFATALTVYTNFCGSLVNALDAYNNDQCSYSGSPGGANVNFSSVANVTYHILVGGSASTSYGSLQITASTTNPPPNDTCAGAIPLTNGIAFVEDTSQATELGDPATLPCDGYVQVGHGVWFTFTPTINSRVIITTAGSTFATALTVYTNFCGSLVNALDAYNNDQCSYSGSPGGANVNFSSVANVTYHILVGGSASTSYGSLQITASTTNPPPNDTCAGAISLTNGIAFVEDTSQATELGDPATLPCDGYVQVGHGVWFTFTPTINSRVIITTAGSTFATALTVYTNFCGSLVNALDAYNNDQCSYSGSPGGANVNFSSVANVTYHILVGGSASTSYGSLQITASTTNPPPNDTCAGAIPLTNGIAFVEDTSQATELGDPATLPCDGYVQVGHGVWFTFTPTINSRVIITTAGSTFATALTVYTNFCGSLVNALDAYNNDQCSYSGSPGGANVNFSSVANVTYHILVGGSASTSYGSLQITASTTNPPPNDTCAGAIPLTNGIAFVEDTSQATELGDPATLPCDGYVQVGHGVWFTFTPTINSRVIITTAGSTFATALTVYTNFCGSLVNALDAYNNDQCSYSGSPGGANVNFSSVANVTYHILVGGSASTSYGSLQITASTTNPPPNDTCAGAISLTNGIAFVEDTSQATELGDPATLPCDGYVQVGHGVWFTFTPTINSRVIITTAGSTFATALTVYTNFCGSLVNALDAYNNDQCSYSGSPGGANVNFSSVANVTYHILVGGSASTSYGSLQITASTTNPPPNDTCAGAIPLANGIAYVENTVNATEIGKAIQDCNNTTIGHGVWFTLQAFAGQQVTVNTCNSSYNGNTDLIIYTNGCGNLGTPFTCSGGSNPSFCGGGFAGVSFVASNNATLYILASGVASASGTLNITANTLPPTNDTCAYAIPMAAGVTYTVTNSYATSIGDPVPDCAPTLGRGVWYLYNPPANGLVGVTTCGSTFQTALAVYTGSCGSMTEVACSQNSGAYCNSGINADVNFYGYAGTNYYILAGGVNGAAGTLAIEIPIVDLVSTGLVASNSAGGQIIAGRNLNAYWTVQNQGSNSINGTWTDSLSLSNATTNVVLATFASAHNATNGGGYQEGGANIPVPQIPAGNYALIAWADATNAVAEADKTNNVQSLPVTVTNLPPMITLLIPSNAVNQASCVAVPTTLMALTQSGSYTVTNVLFYDANTGNPLGATTNAANSVISLVLNLGSYTIGAKAQDDFGLVGLATNLVAVTIHYPTNLNVLRADIATNGDLVGCMCAYSGSNYLVLVNTNLANPARWIPYVTNQAAGNALAFTNHPTLPRQFFRTKLLP